MSGPKNILYKSEEYLSRSELASFLRQLEIEWGPDTGGVGLA
jgi:hypothetical protein